MERTRLMLSLAVLLTAATAHAQYNNTSLGVGVQFNAVLNEPSRGGLSLQFTRYLESGFEFYARAPALIAEVRAGADTPSGAGRVFATGLSLGVRYLFLEDHLRPWFGLQLGSAILITKPDVTWAIGPGASFGLDWVVSDSIALELAGTYELFIDLNKPSRHQLGGTLSVLILL